jgi:hypothetical protein
MGTTKFCDQCGTTVSTLHLVAFGLKNDLMPTNGGGFGNTTSVAGIMAQAAANQQSTQAKLSEVELCDKCLPIWMERVKRLTTASDPK